MRVRHIALFLVLLGFGRAGRAQSIGVFFDREGTDCDFSAPPFVYNTCYVLAITGGASAGGIMGAENFWLEGMPASWWRIVTPNPAANWAFGDLFEGGGCFVGFTTCQSDPAVLLYTVDFLVPYLPVETAYLRLRDNRSYCPGPSICSTFQVLCDEPVYTILQVPRGTAIVNGPPCTVAIQPESWSRLKELYR